MLRIESVETASGITIELHGRLIGPWVPLLESLWKETEACPAQKNIAVDLTDLTGIDGAGYYLLRLMKASNVRLVGGGIGIRALLGYDHSDDDRRPVSSAKHFEPAPRDRIQPRP